MGVSGAATAIGNQLTIYSSLPLQGPSGAISEQIVNGEKLALAEAGGRVGPFKVSYVSLDDSNPASGQWAPGVTATNAKTAAEDTSTIAYLGDYNSAATAVSLPLINAAGILQVSPASPYVGLTSSLDAGQDEPERFYPSGQRTFGRLQPGDPVQAAAQVRLMQELGVQQGVRARRPGSVRDPARADRRRRRRTGGHRGGRRRQPGRDRRAPAFTGEVEKIAKSGAQAVFFAGRQRSGHGGAVAAAAQRRSAPVAAGVEHDGRTKPSPRRSARRRRAPT